MNAAQTLLLAWVQNGTRRSYKAGHAYHGTPQRKHRGGQRGARKRAMRALAIRTILAEREIERKVRKAFAS